MKYKIGHQKFEITDNDIVLFNGVCYQVITQKVFKDWNYYFPLLAKGKAEQLIKLGALHLIDEKLSYTTASGQDMYIRHYQFDVSKLTK